MLTYVIRRLLYAIPILLGVNAIIFTLFFVVNPPEHMARAILGEKNVTPQQIQNWLRDRDYDLPLLVNRKAAGAGIVTDTIFFKKSLSLLVFSFGTSDRNNIDIGDQIRDRMWPSLTITVPLFFLSLLVYIASAMLIAYARGTYLDLWGLIACVILMSISLLFYIIGGQWILGNALRLFPVSGFDPGLRSFKFVLLPILIGLAGGIGASTRFYRIIFLEELSKDYIRTARAKGLSEESVLFRHALKNAMIPILTNVVVAIPLLFIGNLVMESWVYNPRRGSVHNQAQPAHALAHGRSKV